MLIRPFYSVVTNLIYESTVKAVVSRRNHSIIMESPEYWRKAARTYDEFCKLDVDCYFTKDIIDPKETDLWFLHWTGLRFRNSPHTFLVRQNETGWVAVNRVRLEESITPSDIDSQSLFVPYNQPIKTADGDIVVFGVDDLEKLVAAEKAYCDMAFEKL